MEANTVETNTLKYLDWIQTDPKEFNKLQTEKVDAFIKKNGKDALLNIQRTNKHHELRRERNIDYKLNNDQLEKLKSDKILTTVIKAYRGNVDSFGKHMLNLYHNDMPVFITSDMMLYALHRFYDESLEKMEVKLIKEFELLCESLLSTIHNIDTSQLDFSTIESLKGAELYLMVPYFLLQYKENNQRHYREKKTVSFINPKTQPKFNTVEAISKVVNDVRELNISQLTINNVDFFFNATTFKPRGHYTHSTDLENYFMAFTWFSKCVVKLNTKNHVEYTNGFKFATLLSKIAYSSIDQIQKIEGFVEQLVGKPDGYTLSSFLTELAKSDFSSLDYINFHSTIDNLIKSTVLTNKCKLTKVGDGGFVLDESILTEFCFSLIGKGTTFDNTVINSMVDVEFAKHTNLDRKFPSIFDITYTLFDNVASLDFVEERMNGISSDKIVGRDEIRYTEYLETIRRQMTESNITGNTLYNQELVMLKALSKQQNMEPFNSKIWGYKQTQTQIGHYSEIRHDNVLYLDECCGGMLCCEHPDIMIEPCLEFWREMLNLVIMMETMFVGLSKSSHKTPISSKLRSNFTQEFECYESIQTNEILNNFKSIIEKFILFTEYYLNGQEIPETLKENLKCIVEVKRGASGPPTYSGWYPTLFYDEEKCLENKPEVSSYFTAVDDDRGPGGICHLGNGDVQLMYIVINNTIYMGPVYTIYDIVTPFDTRYNDDEWGKARLIHKPLDFKLSCAENAKIKHVS